MEDSNANDNINWQRRALRVDLAVEFAADLLLVGPLQSERAVGLDRSIRMGDSSRYIEVSFILKDTFLLLVLYSDRDATEILGA